MHDIATPSTALLWRRARAMFARAVADIGDATMIAALTHLPAKLRRRIVAWLAPLEHIVRKLLFAEAAAIHRAQLERAARGPKLVLVPLRHPAPAPPASPPPRRTKKDAARLPVSATPHDWRAPFSFALPRDHYVAEANAPRIRALWGAYESPVAPPQRAPRTPALADAPFRLARRLEALRRVLDNPLPYAEQLARVLACAAKRAVDVVKRFLFAPCRTNDYDCDDPRLGVDVFALAFTHAGAFADTS